MLKKTVMISSVILVVCLVAFFALSPLAVSDAVRFAQQSAPAYALLSELSEFSAKNVETVTVVGSWGGSLEVRPSSDDKIHILADNYSVTRPVFKSRPLTDGALEIYCYFEDFSPITLLTRENIQRLIVAHLNNAPHARIVLELPATAAFMAGADRHHWYGLSIDERVAVAVPEGPGQAQTAPETDGSPPALPVDGPSRPEESPALETSSSEAALTM